MAVNPTIDRRLKITFPFTKDNGVECFIHSTPISREVFNKYYLIIAKAYSGLIKEGLDELIGPRVAMHALRSISDSMNAWEGESGVYRGLVQEIFRLTNIVKVADAGGWEVLPFSIAMQNGFMDSGDIDEVEGILAFFTFASTIHHRSYIPRALSRLRIWQVQTTLLNVTDYAASLQTLTTEEDSTLKTTEELSLPS